MEQTRDIYEYELIDIAIELDYELPYEEHSFVKEDGPQDECVPDGTPIEYDADGIPMGSSMEDIRKRESMISEFFHKWGDKYPESKILNDALEDYIFIKGVSVIEAREHSAKSYRSTRAVFILDEVLKNALPVRRVPVKGNDKNQGVFAYMLVMVYRHQELGTIKLTVGVRLSGQRIQYGVSALKPGEPLIKEASKPKKKKRRPHK